MIHNRTNLDSFDFLNPEGQIKNEMIEKSQRSSPNIVGLIAGLITIPVLLGIFIGLVWILWTLVILISPWATMM